MLRKFTYLALSLSLLLLATTAATSQEQNEKRPKDQAEYELITQTFKETDPNKKLELLQQWQEKYPESDFKTDRIRILMTTYQQANQPEKAIETAQELLKDQPGDFAANFTIASLSPNLGKTDQATLAEAERAANALINGGIDQQFTAANKPANVPNEQWESTKKQVTTSSYQTLGWIALQRKNNQEAERIFKKLLELDPRNAQASYQLGQVVLAQGDPNKNELALYSFARAATLEGENALTPQGREQVDAYLTKVYTKYTGTEEGLDQLKQMAKSQPLPPADLKIDPKEVREFQAEQQARSSDPLLYKFIDLKEALTDPSRGDSTWSDLRGKLTPEMSLYVVGVDSARPETITLSSKPGGDAEVVLNLENRLRAAPGRGSRIKFEGVASNLSKSPFRLTLTSGKVL